MTSIRVKLDVSPGLVPLQHLSKCWYMPPDGTATIGQLAEHIVAGLQLRAHDVMLSLDGFVLPAHLPLACLRDGDLVHVHAPNQVPLPAAPTRAPLPAPAPASAPAPAPAASVPAPVPVQPSKRARKDAGAAQPAAKRSKLQGEGRATSAAPVAQDEGAAATGDEGGPGEAVAPPAVVAPPTSDQAAAAERSRSRSARRKAAKRRLRRTGVLPYAGKPKKGQPATGGPTAAAPVQKADKRAGGEQQGGGRSGMLKLAATASPLDPNGGAWPQQQPLPHHGGAAAAAHEAGPSAAAASRPALTPAGVSKSRPASHAPRSAPAKHQPGARPPPKRTTPVQPKQGLKQKQAAPAGRSSSDSSESSSEAEPSSEEEDEAVSSSSSSSSSEDSGASSSGDSSDEETSSTEEGSSSEDDEAWKQQQQQQQQQLRGGSSGKTQSTPVAARSQQPPAGGRVSQAMGNGHGNHSPAAPAAEPEALATLKRVGLWLPGAADSGAAVSGGPGLSELPQLSGLPVSGDVLAYTLLEVGADYSPHVSDVRYGRVSAVDAAAGTVALVPWPDPRAHPVAGPLAEWSARAAAQAAEGWVPAYADSPWAEQYGEDGSLVAAWTGGFCDVRVVWRTPGAASAAVGAAAAAASGLAAAGGQASGALPPPPPRQGLGPPVPLAAAARAPASGGAAWAEVAEQLRLRRQQLTAVQPAASPVAAGSVADAPPAGHSTPAPTPQQEQGTHADGPGQQPMQVDGMGPGAVRPRGGARRGAIGPLLRMLRARGMPDANGAADAATDAH